VLRNIRASGAITLATSVALGQTALCDCVGRHSDRTTDSKRWWRWTAPSTPRLCPVLWALRTRFTPSRNREAVVLVRGRLAVSVDGRDRSAWFW